MSAIQWLWSVWRRLHLGRMTRSILAQLSTRGVSMLFSAVSQIINLLKRRSSDGNADLAKGFQPGRRLGASDHPEEANVESGNTDRRQEISFTHHHDSLISASLLPASLSRLPQDPITQESYSLGSSPIVFSDGHHRISSPVQISSAPPPSPRMNPGPCYLPSTDPSGVDGHLPEPETTHNPLPRSSGVAGDLAPVPVSLLSEAHPRIFPGTPESVGRYTQNIIIPNEPTRFTILPLQVSLHPVAPPPGWTTCLHPEGAQYFFHEEKRVFTDANLLDNASLLFINDTIQTIYDFLHNHDVQLAVDVDLVLDEYSYSDRSKGCQYYFINHQERCIFWIDKAESDMFSVTHELNGITSPFHIRHELEAQYWNHCELFPRSLEVTHEIVDELRDIVLYALGDLITSPSVSPVSWKVEDLDRMVNLIDGFGKNVGKNVDKRWGGSRCLVGRLMCLFVRARVYNFHGDPGARLRVDQSIYSTAVRKRTLLVTLLSPPLFYVPDFHLTGLDAIYTDGLIRHRGWSEFITRLNGEWQEFTLYATVVLNANVAFLSIQSVDQGGFTLPERTPAQISSYLSMLTSIGAIIIGLLLLKQHRDRDRMTAADAAKFIFHRTHPTLGLETLAVLYSLPYAMLIWSMVSFLAAFSFLCFENSSTVTRTLVAVLWAVVAALILWCIFTAWESRHRDWLRSLSCWNNTVEEEEPGDTVEAAAKSPASQSNSRKRHWGWPSLPLRNRLCHSERTASV